MSDTASAALAVLSAPSANSGLFSVSNLIGYAASIVTGAQVIRQLVDSWRVADPVGVSWLTWDLALIQSLGLLFFSVSHGYAAATIINAWVAVISVLIVARTLGTRYSPPLLWPALAVGLTAALCVGWLLILGVSSVGTLGSVASAFVWLPQAVHAIRHRSPIGLSWPFITAGFVSSGLWIVYAILISQWRLIVPPVSAIASLIVTAAFALWLGRRDQQTTLPIETDAK